MSNKVLTIVICTYNRAHIIGECLDSLLGQSVPSTEYDLLIVNNNSIDGTQKALEGYLNRFASMRVEQEPLQGLSSARNRALAEAKTPWLAFLDDDAKAPPHWVQTILETIEKKDFDVFGGPYDAWHYFGPPPAWLPEDFGVYAGQSHYGPLTSGYIAGGNSVFNKNAALAAGGFPTSLGMCGKKCAYGEETHLVEAMQALGFRVGFVPAMKIEHCVLPYKYTLSWNLRSQYARGRDVLLTQSPEVAFNLIAAQIFTVVKSMLRLPVALWREIGKGKAFKSALFNALPSVAYNFGRLSGWLRLCFSQQRSKK